MTTPYQIVRYAKAHREDVLRLQSALWHSDVAVNRAYLDWKYTKNPFDPGHLIYLALADGKVVGMRGFMGAVWEVEGASRAIAMPCGGDTTIARAHQSRGLFRLIMEAAERDCAALGYRYLLNFSAGKATYLRSLRQGWQTLEPHKFMDLYMDSDSSAGDNAFDPLNEGIRLISVAGGEVYLTDSPDPSEMATLIARIGHDGRIRHLRNESYFAWRYANPLNEYRFLFSRDDRLNGYLVLKRSRYKTGPIAIADWEGESTEIKSALLEAAVQLCRGQFTNIWSTSLAPDCCALLESVGFTPRPIDRTSRYAPSVLIKSTDGALPDDTWTVGNRSILSAANWDLRMIHSDGT